MWIKARLTPAPLAVLTGQQYAALGAARLAGRAIGLPDPGPSVPGAPAGPAPEWEEAYRTRFLPVVMSPSSGRPPESEEPQ
jgi:hypothetical protein